jgi:hypothetical protein
MLQYKNTLRLIKSFWVQQPSNMLRSLSGFKSTQLDALYCPRGVIRSDSVISFLASGSRWNEHEENDCPLIVTDLKVQNASNFLSYKISFGTPDNACEWAAEMLGDNDPLMKVVE